MTLLLINVVLAAPIFFLFFHDSTSFVKALALEVVVVAYFVVLGAMLLWNRPKSAINISLVVGGIGLSALAGPLGGLIPLAVLTTRPSNISSEVMKVFE